MSRKMSPEEARETGRRGGLANKANHPPEYLRELGAKGIKTRWARHREKVEKELTPENLTPETAEGTG